MENLKSKKKRICSEVSVNSPESSEVSPEEEKEGYGGKDLQARKVLSGMKEGGDYGILIIICINVSTDLLLSS